MKKERREFTLVAIGAIVGMISIVILLIENGYYDLEVILKTILWFAFVASGIIAILYIWDQLFSRSNSIKKIAKFKITDFENKILSDSSDFRIQFEFFKQQLLKHLKK